MDPLAYTLPEGPVRGVPEAYHPLPPIDLASLRLAVSVDFGQAPVEKLVREAVAGMLTHNVLGRQQITKLKVYAGSEHPHQAQQPKPLEL